MICKKYDLRCFAVGGTLLGAVCHDGFIPWDDDIDLGMMRKDYDKLLKIIRKIKLPHPYRFLTPETDPGYGKGFIRLTNIDTFALAKNNAGFDYNHGIFIDIFPFDAIPDDGWSRLVYNAKLTCLSFLRLSSARYFGGAGTSQMTFGAIIFYVLTIPLFIIGKVTSASIFRLTNRAASKFED